MNRLVRSFMTLSLASLWRKYFKQPFERVLKKLTYLSTLNLAYVEARGKSNLSGFCQGRIFPILDMIKT